MAEKVNVLPIGKQIVIGAIIAFIVMGFVVLTMFSTDILVRHFDDEEEALYFQAPSIQTVPFPNDSLKVMTWNIHSAGGKEGFLYDCTGDSKKLSGKVVKNNLSELANVINKYDPDVLFLQQVDYESQSTNEKDMIKWLLHHTQLSFAVYAPDWVAGWTPNAGAVHSGNMILSKWKLKNAKRLAYPHIEEGSLWTEFFAPQRNMLLAEMDAGKNKRIYLLNTRIEDLDFPEKRKKQIEYFADMVKRTERGREKILIAGGDLAHIPPGASIIGSVSRKCDKGQPNIAQDLTKPADAINKILREFDEASLIDSLRKYEKDFYTYAPNGETWICKTDYLFANRRWEAPLVYQNANKGGFNTLGLSTHAPYSAVLRLNIKTGKD
jgi:endonuclease/exonuclease/phosphatase family metal-dependent hydrolase